MNDLKNLKVTDSNSTHTRKAKSHKVKQKANVLDKLTTNQINYLNSKYLTLITEAYINKRRVQTSYSKVDAEKHKLIAADIVLQYLENHNLQLTLKAALYESNKDLKRKFQDIWIARNLQIRGKHNIIHGIVVAKKTNKFNVGFNGLINKTGISTPKESNEINYANVETNESKKSIKKRRKKILPNIENKEIEISKNRQKSSSNQQFSSESNSISSRNSVKKRKTPRKDEIEINGFDELQPTSKKNKTKIKSSHSKNKIIVNQIVSDKNEEIDFHQNYENAEENNFDNEEIDLNELPPPLGTDSSDDNDYAYGYESNKNNMMNNGNFFERLNNGDKNFNDFSDNESNSDDDKNAGKNLIKKRKTKFNDNGFNSDDDHNKNFSKFSANKKRENKFNENKLNSDDDEDSDKNINKKRENKIGESKFNDNKFNENKLNLDDDEDSDKNINKKRENKFNDNKFNENNLNSGGDEDSDKNINKKRENKIDENKFNDNKFSDALNSGDEDGGNKQFDDREFNSNNNRENLIRDFVTDNVENRTQSRKLSEISNAIRSKTKAKTNLNEVSHFYTYTYEEEDASSDSTQYEYPTHIYEYEEFEEEEDKDKISEHSLITGEIEVDSDGIDGINPIFAPEQNKPTFSEELNRQKRNVRFPNKTESPPNQSISSNSLNEQKIRLTLQQNIETAQNLPSPIQFQDAKSAEGEKKSLKHGKKVLKTKNRKREQTGEISLSFETFHTVDVQPNEELQRLFKQRKGKMKLKDSTSNSSAEQIYFPLQNQQQSSPPIRKTIQKRKEEAEPAINKSGDFNIHIKIVEAEIYKDSGFESGIFKVKIKLASANEFAETKESPPSNLAPSSENDKMAVHHFWDESFKIFCNKVDIEKIAVSALALRPNKKQFETVSIATIPMKNFLVDEISDVWINMRTIGKIHLLICIKSFQSEEENYDVYEEEEEEEEEGEFSEGDELDNANNEK